MLTARPLSARQYFWMLVTSLCLWSPDDAVFWHKSWPTTLLLSPNDWILRILIFFVVSSHLHCSCQICNKPHSVMFPKLGPKHNGALLIFKWALEHIYKPQVVMHLKRLASKYLSTIHLLVTEQRRGPVIKTMGQFTGQYFEQLILLMLLHILGPLFI